MTTNNAASGATDGASQSIGRAGKLDGISGSDNPGTEGATSGAGISQGVPRSGEAQPGMRQANPSADSGPDGNGTADRRQEDKRPGGSPAQPANPTHGVGSNGAPSGGN